MTKRRVQQEDLWDEREGGQGHQGEGGGRRTKGRVHEGDDSPSFLEDEEEELEARRTAARGIFLSPGSFACWEMSLRISPLTKLDSGYLMEKERAILGSMRHAAWMWVALTRWERSEGEEGVRG